MNWDFLAAYQFQPLPNPHTLCGQLQKRAAEHHWRGTIQVSTEGLQVALTGPPCSLQLLQQHFSFPTQNVLSQTLHHQPFSSLRIRLLPQLTVLGSDGTFPGERESPPTTALRPWLQAGHPFFRWNHDPTSSTLHSRQTHITHWTRLQPSPPISPDPLNIHEPPVDWNVRILHEDEALIALHKPAPLPTHPSGPYSRHTLQHLLESIYAPQKIRLAHRLDSKTTGLLIASRSRLYAEKIQRQFADHTVHKNYLARVIGKWNSGPLTCQLPLTPPSPHFTRSSSLPNAITEFKALHHFPDGTTLMLAQPLTGRTHQIRIHLALLGFPILGDTQYGSAPDPHHPLQHSPTPSHCLHSWRLDLLHPVTQKRWSIEAPPPAWAHFHSSSTPGIPQELP